MLEAAQRDEIDRTAAHRVARIRNIAGMKHRDPSTVSRLTHAVEGVYQCLESLSSKNNNIRDKREPQAPIYCGKTS